MDVWGGLEVNTKEGRKPSFLALEHTRESENCDASFRNNETAPFTRMKRRIDYETRSGKSQTVGSPE